MSSDSAVRPSGAASRRASSVAPALFPPRPAVAFANTAFIAAAGKPHDSSAPRLARKISSGGPIFSSNRAVNRAPNPGVSESASQSREASSSITGDLHPRSNSAGSQARSLRPPKSGGPARHYAHGTGTVKSTQNYYLQHYRPRRRFVVGNAENYCLPEPAAAGSLPSGLLPGRIYWFRPPGNLRPESLNSGERLRLPNPNFSPRETPRHHPRPPSSNNHLKIPIDNNVSARYNWGGVAATSRICPARPRFDPPGRREVRKSQHVSRPRPLS